MPELAGARVLVTGASGFIGANLARALLAVDADVHALVRFESPGPEVPAGTTVHRADLRDPNALGRAVAAARPEVVVHLAAGSGHPRDAVGRAAMLQDTVLGTANLRCVGSGPRGSSTLAGRSSTGTARAPFARPKRSSR